MPRAKKLVRSFGGIMFDDDILLNLIEKYGYEEHKARTAYNFIIHHIKVAMKDPERHAIQLPNLGTMYFKVAYGKRYLAMLDKVQKVDILTATQAARRKRIEQQIANFEEAFYKATEGRERPTVHKMKSAIYRYYVRRGKTLEELEEFQNSRGYETEFKES